MSILQILQEIAATSSTKEKESIIHREKDNHLLRQVFEAAYNKLVSYHIKKIPEYHEASVKISLEHAISELSVFSSRKYTGNQAIEYLSNILSRLSKDNAIVIERIIERDLKCGASDSIASRVWPGLVPTFDVMLCDKDMTRIKYPAYAQLKCDGARVHLFFDGENVKAMSRAGKEFQLLGALDEFAKMVMKAGDCWDGELLVMNGNKVADRQTGNGILNKANKGTLTQTEADMIVAVVWDVVDFSSTIPYNIRFKTLQDQLFLSTISGLKAKIKLVPSKIVASEEEAMEFFQEQRSHGEEGAIIKNMNHVWVPKRSKDLCKLKGIQSADLVVVDIYEGKPGSKYVGMLGGLTCETADGKLRVNVGSGFSDEQRANFDRKYWVGSIVECLYNMKIKSKGKDKASLFLPRFVCKRFDKTVANTYKELV